MTLARKLAVSSLGLGYLRPANGTWGTLGGVAIYIALFASGAANPAALALAAVVVSYIAIALGPWAEKHFDTVDPKPFVLDEVAGYLLTVTVFFQITTWAAFIKAAACGFVLFRIFDILKLPPGNWFERLPGGYGITLDDLMGAVYANVLLHLVLYLW
ncbi:MAG: phosphatidylglycerophosphatase A [Planctomycetota bacterium]|nr:MAG: phosphatidylglycerophosphatase A [Planctomycetota bacterium]